MTEKYINIKVLLKTSSSGLLVRMPGFAVKLLEKIIRQKEINRILEKYSEDSGVGFLPKIIEEMNIKVEVEGLENLPENGKCFIVSNHPYGFADGLILTSIIAQKYGTLKAIGNDVFMLVPQLRPLIAAVNVFGRNYRSYLMELERVYHSSVPITHFPAGQVSRINKWKVQDCYWKKSFIAKSIECGRDVVPFYFYGRNSLLFYMIFKLRTSLGIGTNIELMLLPFEFFNKRNRTVKVIIGKPIPYHTFDKCHTHLEWAQWVKEQVYSLSKN
ncbi:MAG: 1-acyl-sn-glycerol-3-phosphate acyltransferase [Bacteroidales bacterium]